MAINAVAAVGTGRRVSDRERAAVVMSMGSRPPARHSLLPPQHCRAGPCRSRIHRPGHATLRRSDQWAAVHWAPATPGDHRVNQSMRTSTSTAWVRWQVVVGRGGKWGEETRRGDCDGHSFDSTEEPRTAHRL